LLIACVAAFFFLSFSGVSSAANGSPEISGPITGGEKPAFGVLSDVIHSYGYEAKEYYLSGSDVSYEPTDSSVTSLPSSGMWSLKARNDPTPYRTRMLVVRPKDPKKFNGTVYVEWINVTGGFDKTVALSYGRRELLREGYIYVGVDAQSAGVNTPNTGLKAYAPKRYKKLNVPTDDKFSYDIFAQAGRAIQELENNPHG